MVVTSGLQGRRFRINLGPNNQSGAGRKESASIHHDLTSGSMEITIDPLRSRNPNWIYKFTSLHSLDNLDSQLLTQNQDCNTLCTAYYLVTFVTAVYIARRSPDRSANINPELNSRFVPWEALVLLAI
jgi:hypothetical protein